MGIEAIITLATLGLKLANGLVERHSGKPIAQMTDEEIVASVQGISLRSVEELVALGEMGER
jgi:hypothetical protein